MGKGYPGILIESDLKKFSHLKPAAKNEARAKILGELKDPLLKEQILGESADEFTFPEKNSCAFSYYNFPISYKRAAIVFAASNDKEHANYFVSASSKNDKNKFVFEMLQEKDFKDTLKKLGYSKIVFYNESSEKPVENIVLNENKPDGREFRVFQRNRFHHDLTLDLIRLSDLCGVAGDQSLTEAFSLGVVPIPEEWHCQITIVQQIAKAYYDNTAMGAIFNRTWYKQRNTDIDSWVAAGEILREKRKDVTTVITKIQEEANLYNALEYRLNLEFAKPQQEKITEYNKLFIGELEKYTDTLKRERYSAFHIAIEIARYYATYQPHEPLTMGKILITIETNRGKDIPYISSIRAHKIGDNYAYLIRENQSTSFLKRHVTHEPSGNSNLASKLQKLHQEYLATEGEQWLFNVGHEKDHLTTLP